MLQVIASIHTLSVLYPSLYFGSLIELVLVVSYGWYQLGYMRIVVAPAPTFAPARRRVTFYKRSQAVVFQLANLLSLAIIESSGDTITAAIAVKVT